MDCKYKMNTPTGYYEPLDMNGRECVQNALMYRYIKKKELLTSSHNNYMFFQMHEIIALV